MVKIGHASIDERGKISGGKPGDQTGGEVCVRDWYAKGWNKVIRPKNKAIAEKIAQAMEAACKNNNIGYNQNKRTTLYTYASEKNWNIADISDKCDCDCSSLVAVCVNAAGIRVSKDIYTGNQAAALKNTGEFLVLTDKKYLTRDTYLKRGDILLKERSHTAIVLSNGSGAENQENAPAQIKVDSAQHFDKNIAGTYIVTVSQLNVRCGAGTGKKILGTLKKGNTAQCYGYYTLRNDTKWYYVTATVQGKKCTGFCSCKYLRKR